MAASQNPANPLNARSLSGRIVSSLPKDSSPQLKNTADAIAIACHAGMLAVGFRLVGLGEDDNIEAHSEPDTPQPLPSAWNTLGSHAFRYKHQQSSMEYLLKCNRLGNKTVIYGIGMGDDKTASFDLMTRDFISESSLPFSIDSSFSEEDVLHSIQSVYISPSRLTDLGTQLRLNIIQKLIPSLQKEGYEESSQTTSQDRGQQQSTHPESREPLPRGPPGPLPTQPHLPEPARPNPLVDPSVGPRRPPVPAGDFPPPGFEDEYEMNRPARGWMPGGYNPSIGERDLYPPGLGPNDPMRPGGIGPNPLRGGGGGGGMHPTFDDPLFAGPRRSGYDEYDPRAPPGARYDPTGPGDPFSNTGGRRFGGGGGGGGFGPGAPPNPFSGFGSGDFI